jgi:acyl-CoA dehydrogenase
MFALVRTSKEGRPQKGISFMLIDMRTPGISVRPIISMSGEHELNEVFFENVRVPVDCLLGEENAGWGIARYLLEFERGGGIFSARLRSSLKRIQIAYEAQGEGEVARITEPTNVGARLAELAIAVDAFEFLEFSVLGDLSPGESPGAMASVLKLRSSRLKQDISRLGIELLGTQAVRMPDAQAETTADLIEVIRQDFLNARAATIFGGSSEVQLELIARMLLD